MEATNPVPKSSSRRSDRGVPSTSTVQQQNVVDKKAPETNKPQKNRTSSRFSYMNYLILLLFQLEQLLL